MESVSTPSQDSISHKELVRLATLAPSPDNNQPWKFVSDGPRLSVFADPEHALPSDVDDMFMGLALGAAIENICIGARHHGLEPIVDYAARPDRPGGSSQAVAQFTFRVRPEADDPLYEALAPRCTCRRPYAKREVEAEKLELLQRSISEFEDQQLDWITETQQIRTLSKLVAAGDRIRLEYQPFHQELYKQLRFTAAEAERTRDGLDVRTLELPPGAVPALRFLKSWSRMKRLNGFGLSRLLAAPSAMLVRRSGAVGLLSTIESGSTRFLDGGRALQRIWLTAEKLGLALHPLGSLPIFMGQLRLARTTPNASILTKEHLGLLAQVSERFDELYVDANNRVPLMLFRLGYCPSPALRSLRRRPQNVLVENG